MVVNDLGIIINLLLAVIFNYIMNYIRKVRKQCTIVFLLILLSNYRSLQKAPILSAFLFFAKLFQRIRATFSYPNWRTLLAIVSKDYQLFPPDQFSKEKKILQRSSL
jgi:hypothetical protein